MLTQTLKPFDGALISSSMPPVAEFEMFERSTSYVNEPGLARKAQEAARKTKGGGTRKCGMRRTRRTHGTK